MQLIIVNTSEKKMFVYENKMLIKIINDVCIGKNGVANFKEAREGDGKTPLGLYNLGVSFGVHDLDIQYPYIKISSNSYWVDDADSKYYNNFVEVGGAVNTFGYSYIANLRDRKFNSAEHLIDYKKQYEYAVFVEFNSSNQIDESGKGNGIGSAIFLHCHGDKGYTGGCIAISKEDMLWILSYLNKDYNPKIMIK